jgi:CRP/FNR family transcriptional regulator, cyclic AMP receptor protein
MPPRSKHILPPDLTARFLVAARRVQLARGQELFGLRSAPQAMFGLISGRVQMSIVSMDGQKFLAARYGAGHWFGEVPLLDGGPRAFHVEAIEATEVAVLSSAAFWKIVKADAGALLAVTRLACARYRAALGWIEDACLKPLPARLAARLLDLAEEGEAMSGLALSQEALAFQLGVARQTVNRQLKQWEREGLLTLQYASITLRKPSALRAQARYPAV